MEFLTSNWFMWVVVIVLIGSFLSIFDGFFDNDVGQLIKKILLFIPMLLIGIVLYIMNDFKNSKLGYIVIFLIIGLIVFGLYMGFKAGPYNPPSE